jgi:transposase
MCKPYSMDLRERLVAYVEAGHSCRAAARVYDVSPSTAVRLAAAQRERGDLAPKPQGRAPGTAGKLAAHQVFLLELVRAEPDITLKELAGALAGALAEAHEVRVQLSSVHRALLRAGYSYKKRTDRGRAHKG